jgi:uncharacterized lipoprotein YbaY/membrane-bound inhibitor of C-type lysozyme
MPTLQQQRPAALALMCLAMGGTAAAAPSAQVAHRCSGKEQVVVLYDNSAREPGRALAWVHDGTQTHRLPLLRSASGARYTDGLWSWWGKGGEARLERKGRPALTGCRAELTQRVLIDRRTRTQWLLPPAWTEERVDETLLQGRDAEAAQPGAQVLARYSARPDAAAGAPQVLAQLLVFGTPDWEALAASPSGAAAGEPVLRTPPWTYVMQLPAALAAPAGGASTPEGAASEPTPSSPPAGQVELEAAAHGLRSGLQLWGRGPLLESCRVQGSVNHRERLALLPGDQLQVQLLDLSSPGTPPKVLAEHRRAVGQAQVPLRFELPCGPAPLPEGADARIVVKARITRGGQVLLASENPAPVLTQGLLHEATLQLGRMRDKPARPSRETSR